MRLAMQEKACRGDTWQSGRDASREQVAQARAPQRPSKAARADRSVPSSLCKCGKPELKCTALLGLFCHCNVLRRIVESRAHGTQQT
jgi:hypothetical protein